MKSRTHKHKKHNKNDNKRLVKATKNIINDNAIKLSSNRIINNPTLENIAMFNTLLQSKLQQQLDQHKSFSPSLNRRLESIQTRRQNKNLFGCGLERHLDKTVIKEKDILINIGSDKHIKCVAIDHPKSIANMIHNFKRKITINYKNLIVPVQKRGNCWFNTMFMIYFISDIGRKYMRFFRELMIKGKKLNNEPIDKNIHKVFLLLNISIEACYNHDNKAKQLGLALNTNNIIQSIYNLIKDPDVPNIDDAGNPYIYYNAIINYLNINKDNKISTILLDSDSIINLFYKTPDGHTDNPPNQVIVALTDMFSDSNSKNFNNKKKLVKYKNHLYQLDSVIIRDINKRHFCACITCNKTELLFDGAAFSKLTKFRWKQLINKDKNWSSLDLPLKFNFMKSYSLFFYYRVTHIKK
tara:strand:+ start:127 stop:1359 length:1233 start_codon:yes stop_codon:yes gene_type:complete